MDQEMSSAEQFGSPCKENEGNAARLCGQDSQGSQRPALQENAFQPLLTPGGPLALSPPRTLRSSQKWGSLSASRILGLSPNGRPRGRSLVLSPMCSRAAPASQGHQPHAGVAGVLPGVPMQDSSSLDFVPPRAARAVPPLGRMCHSQPCPLSSPWPEQGKGIPDNNGKTKQTGEPPRTGRTHGGDLMGIPGHRGTPNTEGEPSEPDTAHNGDVTGIQPHAAAAGAEAASDGRNIYAQASPSRQQATRPDAPNSAAPEAPEQPDGDVGQPNMDDGEAVQQPSETSMSVQDPGRLKEDEDAEARLDAMGGTLGDGPSLQLNLSLGLDSQDDHIMPTEVEPRGFEVTARQLVATERQLTGGFCPETQVEVALQAGGPQMQVPAPIASSAGPAAQQPPLCPDTQILDCPSAAPAQAQPSPSAAQPAAVGSPQGTPQSLHPLLAPHGGCTAYLLTEVQPTAVVDVRAGAAQPSITAAPAAIQMPAQENREASPPQVTADTAGVASTAAATAVLQQRLDSAEESPPGRLPGPMGSPPRPAGVQPRELAVASELLDAPKASNPAAEAPSPLRTPPSGRPSLSLTLLSEDFVSESEGTQRAVQAADIIHRYSYKCLLGDAVGGVFSSVLAADMEALAAGAGRKVSRTVSPETTRWERRLVEAWRDHELLGWDMDGPGDPETSGRPDGLTQEVVAMLCAEEEVNSRREELERTGELRAVRAVREHVQVSAFSAPEAPRAACGAQPSTAPEPGRQSHCLAAEAQIAADRTGGQQPGCSTRRDHPAAAEGTMVGDDENRPFPAGAPVESEAVVKEAFDEVAAVMEALVVAAAACPSEQTAGAAAGQDPIAAKSLSDQAAGMPAPEEQPALPDADCAPMEIDLRGSISINHPRISACAAMQPGEATLEPAAAAGDRVAIGAPALAMPVHGKVASVAADEDDEDSPSLQLYLQLETQYPEQAQQQHAIAAHSPELVPDSEAINTGANGTTFEPAPHSNAGNAEQRDPPGPQSGLSCAPAPAGYPTSAEQRCPPVLSSGPAPGPVPLRSAWHGGTPASAGTLGAAADGGVGAAGPSHPPVPDSEAVGHSPTAAGAPSEPAPVSAPSSGQQGGGPALEERVPTARSQDDAWGAILSTSPQPSCGAGPSHKAPAWQPRPVPGIVAGERQQNQSQPSPGARGWQREVGSSGLRLRPVWGSAPESREATPLTGDTLLTPPKRTLLGPPSAGLAHPAGSASSPDTPSDVAATADVLHLYSRPLQKDIRTPESQRKRPRALASESPGDVAARHAAACGEPEAGARVGRASLQSPDPSGSFVPDTYPGMGAGCGAPDEHAGPGDAGDATVGVQEEEVISVLPMNEEADMQPPKRRRLSLEGGRTLQSGKEPQADPGRERESSKKGLHAMAVHAGCRRTDGAMPTTRARADELASNARPRVTRLQEEKQKRKVEQLKAGRLHRAGQVRPISARKRRTSGTGLKQPVLPSLKRKREAAARSDAPVAGKQADGGREGPAAGDPVAAPEHAQEASAAGHAMTGQDDVSEAGPPVDDQTLSAAAALQAAGGNMRPGRVRDPYSFPETQDVRLENPVKDKTNLATGVDHHHISRRSHAQAQPHIEGLVGSRLHHGAGRDGARATRNPSKAGPSGAPNSPQHCGDTAAANHGQDRWAPQRKRTRLAAESAKAGAAERPQRAKRLPLRFEDYQQGSIAVQDTAEVRLCAPHGGGGRKGAGPPQTHGGRKAAEEAAEKAAGPPRRRLVRLSDLDRGQAQNAPARAPPEERGEPRGMSDSPDVEADDCDEGDVCVAEVDSAHGQEGAPLGEEAVEGAPSARAEEREDAPRPVLKPPKLGCSKCRYSGKGCGTCRRAKAGMASPLPASPKRAPAPKSTRRASLPDAAPEPQQDIGAAADRRQSAGRRRSEPALVHAESGALAGKAFLLTGFEDNILRRQVHSCICKNGGSVFDSIPLPKDQQVVHGVVAGKACDRRAKYLFAHVTGAPCLKAHHLDRCVRAGKWLPLRAEDAWLPARKPRLVFHGYRVHLHGERNFVQQFGALLWHAGCVVVTEMEAPCGSPDPKRQRLLPPSTVGQPNCDLVIVDKADPLRAHPDLQNLMRQARRLTIPVKSVDWMIAALVSGHLPHLIPVLPLPKKRSRAPEPHAAGNSSPGKEAAGPQDAEPLAEAAEDGSGELVEDSESFGEPQFEIRPSLASVSFGGPAAAGPRSPQRAAEGHQAEQQLDNAAAVSGRRPAGQSELRWVGEPSKDPPPGLNMHASHHRNFYSAVAKGDAVMEVGDNVVVAVLGEPLPRVARLEALWSEWPVDNSERLLARCRLYYRPSETSFMSSGKPYELFASDHVEQRLPASTLLQKCTVVCGHPAGMAEILDRCASLGRQSYFCLYQYDHLGEALKPVPAG